MVGRTSSSGDTCKEEEKGASWASLPGYWGGHSHLEAVEEGYRHCRGRFARKQQKGGLTAPFLFRRSPLWVGKSGKNGKRALV